MTSGELRKAIEDFGLRQSDMAQLLGVTPRAISLWLSGERKISGPVEAYVRLVSSLPCYLRDDVFRQNKVSFRVHYSTLSLKESERSTTQKHYASDQEREFDALMKEMGIECVSPEGGRIDFFLPEFDLFVELKTYNCERLHGQLQTVDGQSCIVLVGPDSVKAFGMLLKRPRLNG